MEKVRHEIFFNIPLSETEEDKLVSAIQVNYLERMEKELKTWERRAPTQEIKSYIKSLCAQINNRPYFWTHYSLLKKTQNSYEFISPDLDQLYGIKDIINKIPILPKVLPDSKLLYNFLKCVCINHLHRRDFKITESKVK